MCGRINVSDDPLAQFIADALGIPFKTRSNPDLRPTDPIDVIADIEPVQLTLNWGIKPEWSKRLIINAQLNQPQLSQHSEKASTFTGVWCLAPVGTSGHRQIQKGKSGNIRYPMQTENLV